MSFEDSPPGFIAKPNPTSAQGSKRLYSNDRIKFLTKLKLQEYIESFFRTDLGNNMLLRIVSPSSLAYNIERSFDPRTDPTERKLQIARYFSELRGIIPAILIVDSGIIPVSQSVGLISSSLHTNKKWMGFYPVVRKIPVTIMAVTKDRESTDGLSSVLSLMFNELRNLAGGSQIRGLPEHGENWVITLPNEPVMVGAVNEADISNEPVEKLHYTEISFEIFYEDVISVQQQLPTVNFGGAVVNQPSPAEALAPIIVIPDTISINSNHLLIIKNFQERYLVVLSDINIAIMSRNMIITPRAYGPFEIKVIDQSKPNNIVVARKTVTVV